jgi:hypothetical protein
VLLQYSSNGGRNWHTLQRLTIQAGGAWTASGPYAPHRLWRTKWTSPAGVTFTGAATRAYTAAGKLGY